MTQILKHLPKIETMKKTVTKLFCCLIFQHVHLLRDIINETLQESVYSKSSFSENLALKPLFPDISDINPLPVGFFYK